MREQILALSRTKPFEQFVALLDRLDKDAPDLLRVLTYHRVDYPEASAHLSPSLLSATPESFAEQMRFVQEHYQPVSMQDLLAYYQQGKAIPKRAVLVTVDDAYCDFETYIFPIAQQNTIPLSLFVPTDYPDHPERGLWWDRLYYALKETSENKLETAYGSFNFSSSKERLKTFKALREIIKSLPHQQAMDLVQDSLEKLAVAAMPNNILSWERLGQLAKAGVTLAPHTCSHPLLNRISLNEIRHELRQSRAVLEEKLGATLPVFAYPSGGVSDAVIAILKEEGFQLAFSTERGVNQLKQQNPLKLKRINIGRSTSQSLLRLQCLASFSKIGGY